MNYFDDPNSKHFSFESFAEGMAEDTFGVINFKGYEAISKTYDFEIMLVSSRKDIDLEDILQSQVVFTIHRGEDDDVLFNGILAEFDQLHEVNDIIFYRARLVPKLWWLTLTHHNQVFLNQSVPDFVEDALRDGGLETEGFDIATLSGYQELDYICQYDESHFNFVSRSLERQGIYYYFTQEPDGEVLVLTDTKFSHDALKEGAELFYNPASGLEGKHLGEAIGVFTCRQKQLPTEIILKDYNYQRPSLDITSRADVDTGGRGISYIYGEYFATPEEGERLANIRAEELLCQKQEFFGESTVPYIMPGFTFNMNNHYREDFNQEYLILEVTHEGNQSHLMSAGIATDPGKSQNQAIYHNSFKAIPNDVQYRPERLTEKPKISGTIHAKIDSEVDSEYAQIDEQGRYRVRLPFDINDEHMDGKGSAPVRMMQSYAGKNRGMQFPLVKGTEVLLTFIEGNPDRPIIAGAVSNPETQGPVNADNQSESVIQTGGNNKIRMEDKAGSERIILDSPAANSWIRVGAHNDPITLNGEATTYVEKGDSTWSDPGAIKTSNEAITTLRGRRKRSATTTLDQSPVTPVITDSSGTVLADDAAVVASAGIYQYTYTDVNDKAIRTVVVYEPGEEIHSTVIPDANGIRIRSAGDLWLEAQSRFGDYHIGKPIIVPSKVPSGGSDPGDHVPKQIGDLLDQFGHDQAGAAKGYSPTGLLRYLKDDSGQPLTTNMNDAFAQGHVRVSSLDTFNTQEGNIYDFGGYWNYNLGNSYAEEHIKQSAVLNITNVMYWPSDTAGAYLTRDNTSVFSGVIAGGVTGAASGAIMTTAAVLPFAAHLTANTFAAIVPNGWSAGGAMTIVAAGAAAGVFAIAAGAAVVGGALAGAAVGGVAGAAGLAALAPEGENFQGNLGDVIGGPNSGTIETWAKRVGSSFKNITPADGKPIDGDDLLQNDDPATRIGPMHTDTTWVTKQFGDAYNFTRGNDISIQIGNTEEHRRGNTFEFTYGGFHEETKFNKAGKKVLWEKYGSGVNQVARWHPVSGLLTSYEFKKDGWFTYEGNFVTIPTVKISTNMSTIRAVIDSSVSALDIDVTASLGLKMDIKLNTGLTLNMHAKGGGEADVNFVSGAKSFTSFGVKAQKKAAIDAKIQGMVIDAAKAKIGEDKLTMKLGKVMLDDSKLTLAASGFKFN